MPFPHLTRAASDLARSAYLEELYRGRSVLVIGLGGDGGGLEVMLARGASRVVGIDPDEHMVEAARRRTRPRRELRIGGPQIAAGARFDVVFVQSGESLLQGRDAVPALRERLARGGWLVVAARNADAGAAGGLHYHDLHDRLAPHFPSVTMLGELALAGSVIAPFGEEEREPVLDVSLCPDATPEWYVAIAGPEPRPMPYGLVALPPEALQAEPPAAEERGAMAVLHAEVAEREQRLARVEAERRALGDELQRREAAGAQALAELNDRLAKAEGPLPGLRERLAIAEQAVATAREAALQHAEEMRAAEAMLAERDAYIAEMEREQRITDRVRGEAQEAMQRADAAEARERAARRRIAELEGTVIRLQQSAPASSTSEAAADSSQLAELKQQMVELEARCQKLQQRADEAQREAWAQMRARSEAEAAAAELREDNVRKLKDARKLANVELMRATEEALKKGVTLREELARSEKERKDALAAVEAAREERERERQAHEAREREAMEAAARERSELIERVRAEAAAETAPVLASLEARVVAAEQQRDRTRVERDAAAARLAAEAGRPREVAEVLRELARIDGALGGEAQRLAEIEAALREGIRACAEDPAGR